MYRRIIILNGVKPTLKDIWTGEEVEIPMGINFYKEGVVEDFLDFVDKKRYPFPVAEYSKKVAKKPVPLKDNILRALGDIDASKYDMQNKILKQKEHIKELEKKLKANKLDIKNHQRASVKYVNEISELNREVRRLKCERQRYVKAEHRVTVELVRKLRQLYRYKHDFINCLEESDWAILNGQIDVIEELVIKHFNKEFVEELRRDEGV